ncbi:MAG: autotransporter-associated beta strand repeat-containing protein, partial [Rhodospirillales bacterium]|nr:autotransporter-associated beta strand repeat-containing protein [Rhodospirillales bacterium]
MRIGRLAKAWFFVTAIAPVCANGQGATWLAAPGSSAFNVGSNWTTGTVPTGTAMFGPSNTTAIALPVAGTTTVGAFQFNAGAQAYNFTGSSALRFSGAGIVNNSSNVPWILASGGITFTNASSAGNATLLGGFGGVTFADNSTAANANLVGSRVSFTQAATAANATLGGGTLFLDTATAGSAVITTSSIVDQTDFRGRSTAGTATLINRNQGETIFRNDSSAANATIVNDGGYLSFQDRATAANATISNVSGAITSFTEGSGGLARVIADAASSVWFGGVNPSVGSIEGAGTFEVISLGPAQLTVGANNLSTTLTGRITGFWPATLVKIGAGTLTLAGSNLSGGGLAINGGTVATASDASLGSGSAGLSFGGGTLQLLSSFDLSPARAITINAGGGTIDTNGFGMTIAQAIAGSGSLTKAGNGTLTLTGASTFSGGTVLSAGTLIVNGSLASGVTVNAGNAIVNGSAAGSSFVNGGVLSGGGMLSDLTANGGAVAPGNSIGTLTLRGNLVYNAGATYQVEINAAGQADLITVAGTATINGGAVLVVPQTGNYAPRTTYTILTAAGGASGAFATVNNLYPFLQSLLQYDVNNVYLTLQAGGFAAAAQTPIQYVTGSVLDANAANATGDFATILSALSIQQSTQVLPFLTAISGNNYAGFSTSMVQGMQLFMNNFSNQTGGGGSPMSNRVALAEACDVAC